ncbi:MAG: DNA/RNA non-specific endonuclease [Prevotella sp.]|nr:DNA/RNA non-specific endonuclease [Prevotella sp.]
MKLLTNILSALLLVSVAEYAFVSCDDDSSKVYEEPKKSLNKNQNGTDIVPEATRLEFPRLKGTGNIVIVHHTSDKEDVNISIEWDVQKKAQRWTAYQMHRGQSGQAGRYNIFDEDPELPASARVSNSQSYYSGSGFTRGHICASADRQYSVEANRQTYFYTNIQPQYYMFNAGNTDKYDSPWCRLEDQVRKWSRSSACEMLYVVKGGTIEDHQLLTTAKYPKGKIGDQLPIPKYFFVALLMKTNGEYKALGFWIEHDSVDHSANKLSEYAKSIDELEALTGIDFFCNLPDDIEARVQKQKAPMQWGL